MRLLNGRPKDRRAENAFVAEGVRLLEDALAADWPIRFVLYDETLGKRGHELVERLKAKGHEVEEVVAALMKSISETETPQGILAILELPAQHLPLTNYQFIFIPDQIRDPGNLGTLLRTAAAAGVEAVLVPPETTDPFAPKVVRAGMGAHFRLPVVPMGWEEIRRFNESAKLMVVLADMTGVPCWQADLTRPLALIVGGEAEGASAPARELATETVGIPMPGGIESLNAGVAGSVLMFEVLRQRIKP
ncbi:MAG: RNA methyltransferase [Chloroflexota bacterium]